MKWQTLQSPDQLQEIQRESAEKPVVIFKHSTTCSISRAALDRLERNWKDPVDAQLYYLDLRAFRDVSNQVAQLFQIEHESPQVLIIKDGKAVFDRSHFDIDFASIQAALRSAKN